ncbi:TonB-dependent receptor plug domain-containing protein [Halanaerobaculum tunisiense]
MNKKLAVALVLILVVSLVAAPAVMAEEAEQNEEEETYTLDELVVIASKHPEKLSESPVSVEVIDEEDIEKKSAHNVADLLRDVSSVNIGDHGGPAGQKTISIRGSSSSQVLVLIDSQPINSRQNGQVDLGRLPIDQIEKIEVLKGPASSLYGANALGGVVNITTKSGSQQPVTNVEATFGSFRTQEYTLTHRGSTDKLGYNVSVLKKDSDGFRENPDNDDLNQEQVFTKFDYRLNDHSDLSLSLKYNDSEKGTPGKDKPGWRTPNAEQDDEDTNLDLQWGRQIGNRDQNLNVYYNQHENIYDNPDERKYDGPSEHNTERKGISFDQTDYYQAHTMTYGLEVKKNEIDSTENEIHDYLNKAYFIHDEWQVIDPLKINFGGRYDDHEKFGSEFSPRIGTVYEVDSNLNLHFSAGEAYRTPTFNDLYWPYSKSFIDSDFYSSVTEDYWAIMKGNPNLEPESSKAYEVGVRYLDQDIKGELNLFRKDMDNLIDWETEYIDDDPVYKEITKPKNINSAKISGIELILNKELTSQFSADFNYTYLDAKDEKTDEQLNYKPYHTANLGLNYNQGDINLNLDGKLVSGRYANGEDLPSYFVADLKLSKMLTENADVSLKINNLLDRNYEVRADYPMPGRNVMLSLSKEF